ncbi:YihY/virulence factor BrkB family protein [Microbacterium gorillae]|uniref:YihY/virulence factor BrkB family protein n=1 Tax=Microbacterium gorillae TaxID=1231063 RepID=UPI0006950423|nr:YihY/virulence factor BrkB family protein [Microbacterium gorillae]
MAEQKQDERPDENDEESDGPLAAVMEKAQQVQQWFPVRVFQRFNLRNGNTLAAGASYQALFAIFAAVYVAFAMVGIWLGGNEQAVDGMIKLINGYLPGIIESGGAIDPDTLHDVAQKSVATLGITGVIAILAVFWTSVGWIGSMRVTIRDIFGLGPEIGNVVWQKVRDLIAAIGFAVLLLIGALLGAVGSAALGWVFDLIGWSESGWLVVLTRIVTIVVTFAVDAVTLLLLFRFLTGTNLGWRDVLPGAMIGGAAITVLQLAFGFLVGKTGSNPLLATFAVLIGLLLWIRFVMMAILLSASWVAESAEDHDIELESVDPDEQARHDADVLVEAAELEVQHAETALAGAGFWTRGRARRAYAHAENVRDQRVREREALDA